MNTSRRRVAHRWRLLVSRPESGAGGESLELIIVAVGMLLLILFGIAAGRYTAGSNRVGQAAAAAARSASLQRDQVTASTEGAAAAGRSLADAGVTCEAMTVQVDTADFALPAGQPGTVAATVQCTVSWTGLSVPGLPGSVTLTSRATSPLDATQERP